jgi:hypothetical protein
MKCVDHEVENCTDKCCIVLQELAAVKSECERQTVMVRVALAMGDELQRQRDFYISALAFARSIVRECCECLGESNAWREFVAKNGLSPEDDVMARKN